jgi:hypothetical protein
MLNDGRIASHQENFITIWNIDSYTCSGVFDPEEYYTDIEVRKLEFPCSLMEVDEVKLFSEDMPFVDTPVIKCAFCDTHILFICANVVHITRKMYAPDEPEEPEEVMRSLSMASYHSSHALQAMMGSAAAGEQLLVRERTHSGDSVASSVGPGHSFSLTHNPAGFTSSFNGGKSMMLYGGCGGGFTAAEALHRQQTQFFARSSPSMNGERSVTCEKILACAHTYLEKYQSHLYHYFGVRKVLHLKATLESGKLRSVPEMYELVRAVVGSGRSTKRFEHFAQFM